MLPNHLGNPPAPLLGTKNCCAPDSHSWVWVVVLETLAASLTPQILLFQDEEDKTPHLLLPPPPNWGFWEILSL